MKIRNLDNYSKDIIKVSLFFSKFFYFNGYFDFLCGVDSGIRGREKYFSVILERKSGLRTVTMQIKI